MTLFRFVTRSRGRRGAAASASTYGGGRAKARPVLHPTVSPFGGRRIDLDAYTVAFPSPAIDRRVFNPTPAGYRPAVRFSGRPARVVAPPPRKAPSRPGLARSRAVSSWKHVQFSVPAGVAVCVRRGVRKEVMHAIGAAGGPVRRPRQSEFSQVRC